MAQLNCNQTSIEAIEQLTKNDQENGNSGKSSPSSSQNRDPLSEKTWTTLSPNGDPSSKKTITNSSQNGDLSSEKPLTTSSQNGDSASEKPSPTLSNGIQASEKYLTSSAQNRHQVPENPLLSTAQTADPKSEKPYQGLPKIGIIGGIILAVVSVILIAIIVVVLVKCCVRPRRRVSSAKKAPKGHDVADTVTTNNVTLTDANDLMSNTQTTGNVDYADINLHSLVPRNDTSSPKKAPVGTSKSLVYADLAFNNNLNDRDKVPAVQQMHSLGIIEDDISQLYAKPMKRKK